MDHSTRGAIERVGMLGLCSMGGGMAANLARKGFEVLGYDPRPEALEAAAEAGVTPCASPAEVAGAAQVTLAIPFDYAQVEQAVFGPDGVVEGLQGPGLFVCLSTIGPDSARDLERDLALLWLGLRLNVGHRRRRRGGWRHRDRTSIRGGHPIRAERHGPDDTQQ